MALKGTKGPLALDHLSESFKKQISQPRPHLCS